MKHDKHEKHNKHKKAVTEAVVAANQASAQSSTGPRTERGKSNTFYGEVI